MKSPNKPQTPAELIDQIRHDLKPIILGLRATLQLMDQGKNIEAQEILKESEQRLTQVVDDAKLIK
jgi:hypothetical protein